ncbi:hypothetical protein D3C75_1008980 [compost metagenome]
MASASLLSAASNRMPLSWSVCRVCSRRPSLPKHSQLNGTPGSPRSARASSITRQTVWSLSRVMIWVIWVDDAPWASMRSTSWPISPRSATSESRRGAWRMVRARCTRSTRCRENRSRSETTPHRRWLSTRQTWAMCRSVMAMAASKALACGLR